MRTKTLSRVVSGALAASASLFLLSGVDALAGTADYRSSSPSHSSKKAVQPVECPPDNLLIIRKTADYVFESDFEEGEGRQDAAHFAFEIGQRIPVSIGWPVIDCGQWYFRLGGVYDRFVFGTEDEARVPGSLQSLAGVVALEYVVQGQVGILIESRPGVYFEHDISTSAFDAPTVIGAAIPVFGNDRFFLIAGVSFSLLRSYPVIPLLGVLWNVNEKWVVRGYLPEPRLIYKPSKDLQLWVGGELTGGAYKTDHSNVKPEEIRGAVVTYTDVRVGAGVTWQPFAWSVIDLGAGYSIDRNFDYHRTDREYDTEGAPYVKVSVKTMF